MKPNAKISHWYNHVVFVTAPSKNVFSLSVSVYSDSVVVKGWWQSVPYCGPIENKKLQYLIQVMLRLYQTLVRPKLEYCVQAWRPYFRKDIDLLKKVQKRATRLIISNKGLTYGERLKNLGLTTLETRRLFGDLIEVFKIFKGLDDVKPTDFFTMSNTGLRGHEFKLYKPQAHLDIRKNFLASE